ncbi:ImmA/IrrE family metallo-endopeptidase [Virgibacillus oceani]
MGIKKKVGQLVNKYGTSNPFEIAEAKGIIVRMVPLGGILGFYSKQFRVSIIHINDSIPYEKQLYTCGHELGHAILHPDANTPFLKSYTYYSTDKMEQEANTFAMELLFLQGGDEIVTVNEAVEHYGIPEQLLSKFF